jgi:hypothetical protein
MSHPRLLDPILNQAAAYKARFVAQSQYAHRQDVYSRAHLMTEIRSVADQSAGLGFFITALMFDTLVSYQHESILTDLTEQILQANESGDAELQAKLLQVYKLQEQRPKFQLKALGNDTESVIDMSKGVAKPGALDQSEDMFNLVKDMYDSVVVIPACFTIGGWRRQGRLPESVMKRTPVIVHTPVCRMLERISGGIQSLEAAMLDVEWSLCRPIPEELLSIVSSHPLADEFDRFAGELRQWWYERWQAFRSVDEASDGVTQPEPNDKAVQAYIRNLEVELEGVILPMSPFNEMREYVAIALMARLYNTEYPGAPDANRHFPDGLLWTRPLGKALLKAFDLAGLSGQVIKVDFYSESKALRIATFKCKIANGLVTLPENGKVIGTALSAEDGDYQVSGGLITVKSAHKLLKAEAKEKGEDEVSA